MSEFIGGQRWVSETEPELGVGIVLNGDARRVTVLFHGSGETRQYACDNAPLQRVRFQPGDTIHDLDGRTLKVEAVEEALGLIHYRCGAVTLSETELSHFISFSKPEERLFAGQFDTPAVFQLRYETLRHQAVYRQSDLRGLIGARMALLPHQLYIAHDVAGRYAPRVLLADEVGLGKTIEAGLILHQFLVSGRLARVLILVPEPLLHQWYVELLRRFNLAFSLFDEERCRASGDDNPFLSEQWILCSLGLFRDTPARHQQAIQAGWDLLIVDEAHHLGWTPDAPSPEYAMVEQLTQRTPGLLLLTATPEQLGQTGHFARLRLLDPDRFYDLEAFRQEADEYRAVARLADDLLKHRTLDAADLEELRHCLGEADSVNTLHQLADPGEAGDNARTRLIEDLLDRHGTGRVLFRNTRAAMPGFPQRLPQPQPLPLPEAYREQTPSLWPERIYQEQHPDGPLWWKFDARVDWLLDLLQEGEKILLICASKDTAIELEEAVRVRSGIPTALFHEAMALVARDRAAAYFAEADGARILLCSEIGSEGRNFQFAHRLVLFDLPLDPDLLEQRIGRLDRIGQHRDILIYIPYLRTTPEEALYRWYHEGLDAFVSHARAAEAVYQHLGERVRATVLDGADSDKLLDKLLDETRRLNAELSAALEQGRDRLLELHAHRPEISRQLVERISAQDADPTLESYMERVFDHFGVNSEEHSAHAAILTPGERMFTAAFPGIPEDGVTVTYKRERALEREDMAFLSWDHPMVSGAMELLLGSEQGNASVVAWTRPNANVQLPLLEAIYVVECVAPGVLQSERFLPPTPLRVLIDAKLRDLGADAAYEAVYKALELSIGTLPEQAHQHFLTRQRPLLESMLERAERVARQHADALIAQSIWHMRDALIPEVDRLSALQTINSNVRDAEIEFARERITTLENYIGAAHVRFDALRVVVGFRNDAA